MHVPDGFLDAPTSIATGAVAVAGVAVALRKARTELDDRTAPMAGLVAAFVFAGQMMNFPVGAGVGYLAFRAVLAVLPKRLSSVSQAAAFGALVSVPVAATAFTLLFAIGGNAPVDTGKVLTAMVGWHVLIGIGEAIVTGLVVAAVLAARPDLVHGAGHLIGERELEIRKAATT